MTTVSMTISDFEVECTIAALITASITSSDKQLFASSRRNLEVANYMAHRLNDEINDDFWVLAVTSRLTRVKELAAEVALASLEVVS